MQWRNLVWIGLFSLLVACDADQTTKQVSTDKQEHSHDHDGFALTEIAEGIFVHQGVHVPIDDPQHADIANIGFIVGEECVAVVDTGGSIAIGQQLRAAISRKTDKPVCYVINTHIHFDHVLGNLAFQDDKPKFVGHRDLKEVIELSREFFVENFKGDLSLPDDAAETDLLARVIPPDVLVEEKLEIDLGQRKLVLESHPKAHTSTDLTVYDEKTNTLWLSDLLFMDRIAVIDGSIKGWQKLMDKLGERTVDRVVPGHGPTSAEWPSAMADQARYFEVVVNETREAINKGQFIGDATQTVGQSEKDNWLLFEHNHQGNVSRVFRELEWD